MRALDGALEVRAAAHARADERAMSDLARYGFRFRSIAQAVAFQESVREANRVEAARVERVYRHTRRTA